MPATDTPHGRIRRSLASAAARTALFEQTRLFEGQSDISLGEALAKHPGAPAFNAMDVSATVRNYTLENVILDSDSLILFHEGHELPETVYFEPAHAVRYLPEGTETTSLPDNEDLIFGYNNAHWGYQHWLTQCIPAIDWSLRQKRSRGVRLILPQLQPWQEEFLALLGYDRIPRLIPQAGVRYRLPRVEYSEFLTGATSFAICLSAFETAQRIAEAVPPSHSDDKVLYIREASPYYGLIRNEDAVVGLLRQRGVTIVERGNFWGSERINLFRNADAVIGPVGEGLTDVLFCRPGTLLWEWMPRHYQNASFNRLTQAAQVDYWGDLFENVAEPVRPGEWEIDTDVVVQGMRGLSAQLAYQAGGGTTSTRKSGTMTKCPVSRPLDELMMDFESLGDNCEFGLVQRHAGAEPLGLLRFNRIHTPPEFRLEKLLAALEARFVGLGAAGTVTIFPVGVLGQRELIVRDSVYEFWYHSGIAEGEVEIDEQLAYEITRLGFLRRKLLQDLTTGDKTWVWKSPATTHRAQIQPLLDLLRRLGPNIMLWVVEADAKHAAGTVEMLEPDLIRGYVAHFAPDEAFVDIHLASWFEVCRRTDELRHPHRAPPEPDDCHEAPEPTLTAMNLLTPSQPVIPKAELEAPGTRRPSRWLWWR